MRKLKNYTIGIEAVVFIVVISLLGIANLLNFEKPAVSVLENRALNKKPTFSIESLFNGSYFRDFENYYSDTFIMRDSLVKANRDFKQAMEFLGPDVTLITAYEDIQLPPDNSGDIRPNSETGSKADDGNDDGTGHTNASGSGSDDGSIYNGDGTSEERSDSNGINGSIGSAAQGTEENYNSDFGDGPDVGYWLVEDGKAIQLFKFKKESFDYYSQILNKYSEKLGSSVKIYSMIPPTNSEFVQLKKYKGITDSQNDALGFLKSKLDGSISSVNVYDALNKHKDEYIYFRTDHHWTALGAYYAYEAFMNSRGDMAVPLYQYETLDLGDFLGSSYTKTLNKSLEKNPDNIIAYKPFTEYEYLMYYASEEKKADVLDMDYADDITQKYLTFLSTGGGTWSVIKTDVHNGQKIAVIKDSFGNALVPFLLPHYEEIYIVDARFYNISAAGKNIVEFINEKEIDELLFVIYMEDVNWHKFMSGVEKLLGE